MKNKINQAQPEGIAQPEIEINSRWKDSWGVMITITKVEENRINYVRDGYAHPCISSTNRLRQEFTHMPEHSKIHQEKSRAAAAERIREMKKIIRGEK